MAESEEELKSLLMKVKEESEKAGLNSTLKKLRSWHPVPSLHGHSVQFSSVQLLQSCPTLCDPIDGSPPGSPVPGTLQARTLEWVAISFSNA